MQEKTRKKVEWLIENHKQAIKNNGAKIALARNPNLPRMMQEREKFEIQYLLNRLRDQRTELLPFVKGIKKHVKGITENTHVCAVYILLSRIFQNWDALFLLAEHGKNSPSQNLMRMIKEGCMLVKLFTVDSDSGERKNLDKWFSGDIVSHGIGRDTTSEYFDEHSPYPEIDTKKLESHIYQMESQASHNAYASILESVSPFTEDFDFDGHADFHHTKAVIAEGSMTDTAITLKAVYSILLKDIDGFEKISEILIKYNPDINDPTNKEDIKEFIKSDFEPS
ncbi:MAG: hypothetical protein A3F54_05525 [Candidatus Kerfeldbacteria bacterium RIFCSPHIGHO2_12_FULL_48_17]|uniref:Uncharacterized protein n=1 Tax=Candidatus Kerfeldbacteria bacterium RIFCSPHIGHO2_12_FULL_48_17 TaxID=1798542 RepID=A0A1G2B8I7_9BACT|nr:MAG: hypothetical protein A3F54_05525 [Candidatus Kerfeldbacteria bacterium RIFCSPHIGHO2_12_FULL_48_17]